VVEPDCSCGLQLRYLARRQFQAKKLPLAFQIQNTYNEIVQNGEGLYIEAWFDGGD